MVSNQRGIHDDDVDDLESGRVVGRRLAGRIVRSSGGGVDTLDAGEIRLRPRLNERFSG